MNLTFFAGVEYKNKIYFSAYWVNGLFTMDLDTHKITFLKLFEKEKMKVCLHRCAFLYCNEAWFIPQEADYISCLNLDSLEISYFVPPYKNKSRVPNFHAYFTGHVIQERYLLLIPGYIDTVSLIDMKTHEIKEVYYNRNIKDQIFADGFVYNNKLVMIPKIGNKSEVINLTNGKVEEHEWTYGNNAYSLVAVDNEKIWFSPLEAEKILCYDIKSGEQLFYDLLNPKNRYSEAIVLKNEIVFCPILGDDFAVINTTSNSVSYEHVEECREVFPKVLCKMAPVFSKNHHIICTCGSNYIMEFGNTFKEHKIYQVTEIPKDIPGFVDAFLGVMDDDTKEIYAEHLEEIIGLDGYIESILNQK